MSKIFFYLVVLFFLAISAFLTIALNYDASLFLSIFSLLALSAYVVIEKKIFSPVAVLVVTAVPYLISAPWDIYFFDSDHHFDKIYMSWLLIAGVLFLLSFIASYDYFLNLRVKYVQIESKINVKTISFFYLLFYMIYLIIVSYYFSLNVGSLSRADIYANKPTFFDVYKLFLYSFTILVFWYLLVIKEYKIVHSKIIFFTFILLILTDTIILGDRKTVLVLIFVISFFYKSYNKIPKSALLGFIALGFGFWVLGFVRNLSLDQWGDVYSGLSYSDSSNPANVEFGAFPQIWQDYFSRGHFEFKPTYLESFIQLIPSFIYPDRPVPPSVDFVARFYPAIHAEGGGLAFNAILESIMNFYWFGPLIVGAGFGFLFRFYNEKNKLGILIGGMLIYTFAFMMRNDMVTMLRSFIFCGVVAVLFVLVFCKVIYKKS